MTYLRFVFGGEVVAHDPERKLDEGILGAHWLPLEQIRTEERHRSPMVLSAIEDWLAAKRYPLELMKHYA